jgi:AcrR family transcriptional regulator
MARKPVDRRVARTKTMLQDALIALILKKGYEAITIEEICEAANVGRSTFYSHYTSKEDLQRSGIENHLRRLLVDRQRKALAAPDDSQARRLGFSLTIFEHARDHRDLYRALIGDRSGGAPSNVRQMLSDLVRIEIGTTVKNSTDTVPRDLIVRSIVGAYLAALTWWLEGDAKQSPGEMDATFQRFMTAGIIAAQA